MEEAMEELVGEGMEERVVEEEDNKGVRSQRLGQVRV